MNSNESTSFMRISVVSFIFVWLLFPLHNLLYTLLCCLDLDYVLLNSKHFLVLLLSQGNPLNEKYLILVLINSFCKCLDHFCYNGEFQEFYHHLIVNSGSSSSFLIQFYINYLKKCWLVNFQLIKLINLFLIFFCL